ncbi:hypothetical protein CYMTET_5896 [Cymbomonas tetramitiformis]|uniref:Uncharacterized protein n=1 Tax=Cymbomonas tetramitiformis TaxID=36881 RepID=A0AAE0GYR4_9CHLO|nr:hypothetical protein CYMTET_5896 [Cymbomonas tetramitiformis]
MEHRRSWKVDRVVRVRFSHAVINSRLLVLFARLAWRGRPQFDLRLRFALVWPCLKNVAHSFHLIHLRRPRLRFVKMSNAVAHSMLWHAMSFIN